MKEHLKKISLCFLITAEFLIVAKNRIFLIFSIQNKLNIHNLHNNKFSFCDPVIYVVKAKIRIFLVFVTFATWLTKFLVEISDHLTPYGIDKKNKVVKDFVSCAIMMSLNTYYQVAFCVLYGRY